MCPEPPSLPPGGSRPGEWVSAVPSLRRPLCPGERAASSAMAPSCPVASLRAPERVSPPSCVPCSLPAVEAL